MWAVYWEESHMTNGSLAHCNQISMSNFEMHALVDTVKRILVVFPHEQSHCETAAKYLGLSEEELPGKSEHLVGAMIFIDKDPSDQSPESKWRVDATLGMSSMQTRYRIKNSPQTLEEAAHVVKYYFSHAKLTGRRIDDIKIDIVPQRNV